MRWRSSTLARWLGWTLTFGLAQAGAIYLILVSSQAYSVLGWILLASLAALAFIIGVRLRTWWWGLGPAIAYGVPAAVVMIAVNAADQSRSSLEQGLGYALIVVTVFAAIVVAPCALAALTGAAWAALFRTRAPGRHRVGFAKRWSGVRRFFTIEDVTDEQVDWTPPS